MAGGMMRSLRLWLPMLALLALFIRAVVPTGFMPVVQEGRLVLDICSGYGAAKIELPGKAPKPQPAEHCAFAGLGTPLIPEMPFAFAAIVAAVSLIFLPGRQAPVLRAAARLRPPLRGPPVN
jgi:hypothetical protein